MRQRLNADGEDESAYLPAKAERLKGERFAKGDIHPDPEYGFRATCILADELERRKVFEKWHMHTAAAITAMYDLRYRNVGYRKRRELIDTLVQTIGLPDDVQVADLYDGMMRGLKQSERRFILSVVSPRIRDDIPLCDADLRWYEFWSERLKESFEAAQKSIDNVISSAKTGLASKPPVSLQAGQTVVAETLTNHAAL